jgi:PAS domain S-box-containing protein
MMAGSSVVGDENFRALVECISDIVLIGDLEGRVMYSNPATSTALGYDAAELLGMHILELHPEFVREEAGKILADMFAGVRESCPLPLCHKSGALVPVETRVWKGRWNGAECIVGLCRDLSKVQEALQKFDRLFRMNPAPMAVSNLPEQAFIEVNDAWLKTLGYSEDEVIGKRSPDLNLFVDHEEQLRVATILRETGRVRDEELRVRAKNGRILYGLFSGEIIESQGKSYFLTVMNDITERKKIEAERHETIRELRAALGEIRDLQGILPICASCKKVRDDTGYWEQVESYVSRHTGAQFSHGVCPECIKTLYPEYSRQRPSD